MKWKAAVPIAIILIALALALSGCGPEIKDRASDHPGSPGGPNHHGEWPAVRGNLAG